MTIVSVPYRDPWTILAGLVNDPDVVFLNGSCLHNGDSRYSYVAVDPICTLTDDGVHVRVDDIIVDGNPFDVLEREIQARRAFLTEGPVPFCGGALGALGYELGGCLEKMPSPKSDKTHLPRMNFGFYDVIVAFDHRDRKMWVLGSDKAKAKRLVDRLTTFPDTLPPLDWTTVSTWCAEQDGPTVTHNIQAVIDAIYAGDIFQANYTQKYWAKRPQGLDDFTIYRRLCALSPSPFSVFMKSGDITLAGVSPERFLCINKDRSVEAWPIKGTRSRGDTPLHDVALATELLHSAKDRAENLMIVDLMRSDLGRVCKIGSMNVPRLNVLESFSSVHHLVSRVTGQLREGLGPVDVLRATFPGGSITGAPKIRAMQIIHDLEPSPRGFYCGCLGWIGFDGRMDMSMTIRTLTLTRELLLAQAGSGIVADSDPRAEYNENLVKIAPLLKAVRGERP